MDYFFVLILQEQSSNAKNWSGTNSGDYVIYRDYSWQKETWIGFLYYNKNTIGSFLYTDNGKTFVKILFSGEEVDGEFVILGQNNISGRNNDSNYIYAVNYLMQILPKLYKWREKPQSESLVVKRSSKRIFEPQYGGECSVNFVSYIPLFYISSVTDKAQKKVIKLDEMGLVKDDKAFFSFSPIKIPKEKKSSFALNKNAKKTIKNIDGIKLNLDSQWKQDTQNTFFLSGVAFLVVSPVPNIKNNANAFIIKYLCSSGVDAKVMLDQTDIIGSKNKFKIISPVYDVKTNSIKTSIKLVMKYQGLKYKIVSLTVDHYLYEHNKEYFDNLF